MSGFVSLEHLSPQFQIYLLILHTIVLGWIVHILINVFHKNSETQSQHVANVTKNCPSIRVVHVDDKRVTVESCHWLNSILNWFHMNASNTPDLVKIWLTMLNEKLKADKVQICVFFTYSESVYELTIHKTSRVYWVFIEIPQVGKLFGKIELADEPKDISTFIAML